MFTLVEQSAATDCKDFLFRFKNAMELEGFTTEYYGDNLSYDSIARGDKLIISKDGNNFYFAAGINEDIFCIQTGAGDWTTFEGIGHYFYDQLDLSQPFGEHIKKYDSQAGQYPLVDVFNMNLTSSTVENFWIYKNTDDCYVVIIEYAVGLFTHFVFGGVKIFDQNRTVAQLTTSSVKYGNSQTTPTDVYHRALFSNDLGDGQILYYNSKYYTKELSWSDDDSRTVKMYDFNSDTFIPRWSYSVEDEYPNMCIFSESWSPGINGSGSPMGRTKVKFNDKNFPIPTKIWANIRELYGNDGSMPLFEIEGFYNINFETIQPAEVLTFGTKQFICFPHYQKNNPQDYQNDERGRGLGIALKIAD